MKRQYMKYSGRGFDANNSNKKEDSDRQLLDRDWFNTRWVDKYNFERDWFHKKWTHRQKFGGK